MLTNELLDKPIFQMTGGEFLELMRQAQPEPVTETQDFANSEFVMGISGLARFLGCGRTKAAQLRAERVLEDATYQVGSKLFFNKKKVKEILKN